MKKPKRVVNYPHAATTWNDFLTDENVDVIPLLSDNPVINIYYNGHTTPITLQNLTVADNENIIEIEKSNYFSPTLKEVYSLSLKPARHRQEV